MHISIVRIITGCARSTELSVPDAARPIGDRAKSSLFSVLGTDIVGKRILDVYAGSGSLGIEALSRGSAQCTFVDSDREAITALKANLHKTHLFERSTVTQQKTFPFLSSQRENSYDIVFADPPYDFYKKNQKRAEALFMLIEPIIPYGGAIVLKHPPRIHLPQHQALLLADSRTFADCSFSLWVKIPKADHDRK